MINSSGGMLSVTDLSSLTQLRKRQVEPASEVLSRAFIDDPSLSHAIPEYHKRVKILPALFRMTLYYGISHGEVYAISPDMEGIAIWLPSGVSDIKLWMLIRRGGLALLFWASWKFLWHMKRDEDFASALRKRHAPFPHWYLAVLGVDPEFQGKGYASKLLQPMLNRLDAANSPCYVETSIEEYVPMYQHFGFRVIYEGVLPGSGSRMWAMLREKAD